MLDLHLLSLNFMDNLKVNLSCFSNFNFYDKKIYIKIYTKLDESISKILQTPNENLYSVALDVLEQLQKLKLEAELKIKEEQVITLLNNVINSVANLIANESIIKKETYNSPECNDAVRNRIKELTKLSNYRQDAKDLFRKISINESNFLWFLRALFIITILICAMTFWSKAEAQDIKEVYKNSQMHCQNLPLIPYKSTEAPASGFNQHWTCTEEYFNDNAPELNYQFSKIANYCLDNYPHSEVWNCFEDEINKLSSPYTPNNQSETAAGIYSKNVKSMLYILTQSHLGSGVIVNEDGTFITCFHVIADADYIKVRTNTGEEYPVTGFKYINPLSDVAILTIKAPNKKFQPIHINPYPVSIGEKVYTISNPLGEYLFSFSDGMVNQITRDYIQFSAPIAQGSSGGAVLNEKGELIGIITSLIKNEQNINFALPNEYYTDKISDPAIYNTYNQKWTDFVLNNASKEQFKLLSSYAINEKNYSLLYKYLEPYAKLNDFPKNMYAVMGFWAYTACLINNDSDAVSKAIYWYEKSIMYGYNKEVSLLALINLYMVSNRSRDVIDRTVFALREYPESYVIFSSLFSCRVGDSNCSKNVLNNVNNRIAKLTEDILRNQK